MRRKRWVCYGLATLVLALGAGRPALGSGIPVLDAAALAKHVLTALQTAKSNINEAMMLKNQVDAYVQQARNLTKLPMSLINDIQSAMRDYRNILARCEGISYQLEQAQRQIEDMYGKGAQVAGIDLQAMAGQWATQVKQAALGAMQTQAIVERLQSQQVRLGAALSFSDTADGNVEVQQAGNQLLALQVEQNAALLELQAATARVEASFYAEFAASQELAKQRSERWLQRDRTALPAYQPPGQTSGGVTLPDFK